MVRDRIRCIAAAILLLIPLLGMAAGEGSRFSHLGLDEGLSQMSVMKIYQDSKGYIWLGTRNGLNKYDGHSVTVYKPDSEDRTHSLVDRQITAIAEDSDRNLWIGTGKGLSRLDTETGRITSYSADEHPWLSSGVRSVLIDSDGSIWVGTSGVCICLILAGRKASP